MNDIVELTNDIELISVDQNFSIIDFDQKKLMLKMISDKLKTIEVTEDNLTENRKLLARIRKALREVDEFRKVKRREALEPYNHLAGEIKELEEIVSEGDQFIDTQIKLVAEKRREEKEEKLREVFVKRITHYPLIRDTDFEYFILPAYLNESCSFRKVEIAMSEWLEKTNADLDYINTDTGNNGIDYEECREKYFTVWMENLVEYLTLVNGNSDSDEENDSLSESITQLSGDHETKMVILQIREYDLKRLVPFMLSEGIIYNVID